jgi:hypothetical protein
VSGQKLCEILTPALLAAHWFLSFQNQKFINLTTLLTTVFINRHIFSFTLTDANTLPTYTVIFLFHFKLVSVSASSLMSSARIVNRKLLKLILT